jgi:hypothetical protein
MSAQLLPINNGKKLEAHPQTSASFRAPYYFSVKVPNATLVMKSQPSTITFPAAVRYQR